MISQNGKTCRELLEAQRKREKYQNSRKLSYGRRRKSDEDETMVNPLVLVQEEQGGRD